MAEDFRESQMKATFIQEDEVGPGIRYASGKTLRREYLYNERAKFLLTQAVDYVWSKRDEDAYYPTWKREAEILYPDEGEYIVDVATGTATFQGLK